MVLHRSNWHSLAVGGTFYCTQLTVNGSEHVIVFGLEVFVCPPLVSLSGVVRAKPRVVIPVAPSRTRCAPAATVGVMSFYRTLGAGGSPGRAVLSLRNPVIFVGMICSATRPALGAGIAVGRLLLSGLMACV